MVLESQCGVYMDVSVYNFILYANIMPIVQISHAYSGAAIAILKS